MESIIIIIIGLLFSVISKSAKQNKEVNSEKERRKRQLQNDPQVSSSYEYMGQRREDKRPNKQKGLRELFLEEIKKLEDENGTSLGDAIKTFRGEQPPKEESLSNYELPPMEERSLEQKHLDDDDYYERHNAKLEEYSQRKREEQLASRSSTGSDDALSQKNKENRKYNPFSKSINKKDIIRGIIFSEVIDKPKSLRNQKRSM